MAEGITFDGWVRDVFDHPVAEKAWYRTQDAPEPAREQSARFMIRLFGDAEAALSRFSPEQAAQGLDYLVNPSCSDYMFSLVGDGVPEPIVLEGMASIEALFRDYFERRCAPKLSHLDEAGRGPLNGVCYMWWDVFPASGQPDQPEKARRDEAILLVLERTVRLKNDACREAALHGLGHWAGSYPVRVKKAVEDFLSSHPDLRPELKQYALNAKSGHVN